MDRRGGYALNPNKPAFSLLDDDDIASEFMSTTGARYLAADRLPPGPEQQAAEEAEIRRQETLRQMREIEHRTVQSSKNCLTALSESERVGIETAEELVKQREQLMNTDRRLDDINGTLKDTQKDINGIKSVFSSLKNWWTAPKKGGAGDGGKTSGGKEETEVERKLPSPTSNPNLGPAYKSSQQSISAQMKAEHPALRLKGLEDDDDDDPYREDKNASDFRAQANKVNQQLDSDLDEMSLGLARLKGLAVGLGSEIEDQNQLLDRITTKADRADMTIGSQNAQMKKILGKK